MIFKALAPLVGANKYISVTADEAVRSLLESFPSHLVKEGVRLPVNIYKTDKQGKILDINKPYRCIGVWWHENKLYYKDR